MSLCDSKRRKRKRKRKRKRERRENCVSAHAHRLAQVLLVASVVFTTCKSRIRDTKDPSSHVYDRTVKVSPKGFTIKAGSFQDIVKWIKRAWFFNFGSRFKLRPYVRMFYLENANMWIQNVWSVDILLANTRNRKIVNKQTTESMRVVRSYENIMNKLSFFEIHIR